MCLLAPAQGFDVAKRATMEFLDSFAEAVDPEDREILRCVARCLILYIELGPIVSLVGLPPQHCQLGAQQEGESEPVCGVDRAEDQRITGYNDFCSALGSASFSLCIHQQAGLKLSQQKAA